MKRNVIALVGFYIPVLFVQFFGSYITEQSVMDWYPTLAKSELTPPGFVFGIVWTILYLLMTIAAWRVWRIERRLNTPAQRMWLMQLLAGLAWTCVFFGMKLPQVGLAMIACVVIAVAITLRRFMAIDRLAGRLMVPLLLWVSFATYLQLVIVMAN